MTRVRVYLPVTSADLVAWQSGSSLVPPREGYAVTPALRAGHPGADLEELEYAALVQAAAAAGRARGGRPVRRAIAAVDLAPSGVEVPAAEGGPPLRAGSPGAGGSSGLVQLRVPLVRRDLVAVHADERPGGVDDADLMWFDATELDLVSAEVAATG